MPSDPQLLSRLYGEPPPPPPEPRYGWAPAVWLGLLLAGASAGFVVAFASGLAVATGVADTELVRAGVLHRDERVLAYADEGTTATGCAIVTSGYLVRWEDGAPAGRVDLRAGELTLAADRVTARSAHESHEASCLVGDQGPAFSEAAAPFLTAPSPLDHPGRDPRVDRYRMQR